MFRDRHDAGRQLAEALVAREDLAGAIVLGVPRGGVIVAAEVAQRLGLPLSVVVAAKVGAPGNSEYAVGAVDPDGVVTPNPGSGYSADEVEHLGRAAKQHIAARIELYLGERPPAEVNDRTVIVCDDGIATGLTVLAACEYLRRQGATHVVVAVPVSAPDSADTLRRRGFEVVALEEPVFFSAVGQFYRRFEQTSNDEVLAALSESRRR